MTDTPDTPTARVAEPVPAEDARAAQPGRVAELGLVAAGLGLVIYLIGFAADLGGVSSPVLPLLLGGGLLAGTVALPTVSRRVLAPAAVATGTGALLLLREVVDDGGTALGVGALVLGLLAAGATVGATLLDAGVLRSRPPRLRRASTPFAGHPDGPRFPGQQYPGQPYPGAFPPATVPPPPGDQWTGEHAYGQYAQFGGQYGVPGYPPPPYGTPRHDPAPPDREAPTGDIASPPRGTPEVAGERTDTGTGAHRAVPDPGAAAFRAADPATGTGAHRAVPDPAFGTGSFRIGSRAAADGTGAHRAVTGTGSIATGSSPSVPFAAGPARRSGDDGEHTEALPAVPDEPR